MCIVLSGSDWRQARVPGDVRRNGCALICTSRNRCAIAEQHTWYGSTTIEIAPDTDAEEIVRALESHFREGKRFDVRTRRDVVGEYELQLMSPETAETYIIGPDDGGATIRIGSGSPCFTLPDDVYPGGTF